MERSVLIVPAFFPTSDSPTLGIFFRDQARLVASLGYDVHVVHLENRPIRKLTLRALSGHHFQIERHRRDGFTEHHQHGWNPGVQTWLGTRVWAWLASRLARSCVRQLRHPPIVHVHNALLSGLAGMRISSRIAAPLVVTEHSSAVLSDRLKPFERDSIRRVYCSADRVIAVSAALSDRIRVLTGGAVRAEVVPNPIDTEFFRLDSVAGVSPRRRCQFAMICNLVPVKRIDLALRAISAIRKAGRDVDLVIGGTGPLHQELLRMSESLGVMECVRFLGRTDREAGRRLMAESDGLLVTSDHETFSMVSAEAMAMGRPVIATDCGGPRDFVSPETGILIPVGDQGALERSMVDLADGRITFDPERLRHHVVSRFGLTVVGRALDAVYRGLAQ